MAWCLPVLSVSTTFFTVAGQSWHCEMIYDSNCANLDNLVHCHFHILEFELDPEYNNLIGQCEMLWILQDLLNDKTWVPHHAKPSRRCCLSHQVLVHGGMLGHLQIKKVGLRLLYFKVPFRLLHLINKIELKWLDLH